MSYLNSFVKYHFPEIPILTSAKNYVSLEILQSVYLDILVDISLQIIQFLEQAIRKRVFAAQQFDLFD